MPSVAQIDSCDAQTAVVSDDLKSGAGSPLIPPTPITKMAETIERPWDAPLADSAARAIRARSSLPTQCGLRIKFP
jgi:hypothetical protein